MRGAAHGLLDRADRQRRAGENFGQPAVDRGIQLWNKTGTNDGVRCDIGAVRQGDETVTYAALANWTPQGPNDTTRDDVLTAMRDIGLLIKKTLAKAATR